MASVVKHILHMTSHQFRVLASKNMTSFYFGKRSIGILKYTYDEFRLQDKGSEERLWQKRSDKKRAGPVVERLYL
jgi:hypothetical protein